MTCADCGQGICSIVEQEGGTKRGTFKEIYECNVCGAMGTIRGRAEDPPVEWVRTGSVFEDS